MDSSCTCGFSLFTRLEKIAQQWLKILQTAQQTLAEQAKRSAEIPQVYIAGASLNPDDAKTRFKGRQDSATDRRFS
jgi:uncharacterized protein